MTHSSKLSLFKTTLSAAALSLIAAPALADQVILDDLIVDGSLCAGQDCVNGESFGFDTLRLKENNLRIKFQDTSASASFPSNDWELTANDSSNGGGNYFAITDVNAGRQSFRVDAGAPANSLRVDSAGNVGVGVDAIVELHVRDGDSPTLRLEQDGSSGFATQTFDIAANETNFFVRDVSNGSQLPFKIIPGADNNALVVAADNSIGMGTDNTPDAPLHVRRSDGTAAFLVEEVSSTADTRELMKLSNNGQVNFTLENTSLADAANTGREWKLKNGAGEFSITTFPGGPGEKEFALDVDGNLEISGNFISNGTTLTVPDYVFADDYVLRPLAEVQSFIDTNSHLPEVPSAADIAANGINHSQMQMVLLKKIEELTLYTLDQQTEMNGLKDEVAVLKAELATLETAKN